MQSVSIFFFKFIHPCFLLYLLLFIRSSFYVLSGYFYVAVNLVAVPSVWIRDTAPLRVLKCLSPCPHRTYLFVFENGDFFPSGLAYRPPVSGENGQRKRIFSNHSPEESRNFRKRRLLDSCRWRKNEYVEVLDPRSYPAHEMRRNAHAPIKEGTAFSHYCIFVWTGKKQFKNAKWEEKRRKKSPLSNKNGYVWTGTNLVKKLNDMLFDNIHTFPLPRDGLTFCLNFQHSTDDHNPEDESERHSLSVPNNQSKKM